jgi:hypothetical protein
MKLLANILEIALVVVFIVLLLGLPTMLLWNWIMPTKFGLPKLDFMESCGLTLLTTILFKSNTSNTNKQ